MEAISRYSVVFALVGWLAGCDLLSANRDARIEGDEVLLHRDGCFHARVSGIGHFEGLYTRADDMVVTHELVESEDVSRAYLRVCGAMPGMTVVQLVGGRGVLDSLAVEVAEIGSLALAAAQDASPQHYPAVPRPVGLLVGRRALLYLVAYAPDGRPFEHFFYDVYDIVIEPPVETMFLAAGLTLPRSPEPGVFPVAVVGRDEVRATELVVVGPEDIERIEVAGVTNDDGGGGYSVTGVTADGFHILGLEAELTIDGEQRGSQEGSWLFRGRAPGPGVSVVATWNGLEATLE